MVDAMRDPDARRRLVLEAPTGSGKSTQVPQILLDGGLLPPGQMAVVLQPRRVAARMLARRVAAERGQRVGEEIGFQVRFENESSPATRILYVTEGVLLRKMLDNPALPNVSAILFDEFHERHFFGDITLARARQIQEAERPDLALLVMSATLDGEAVSAYLGGAPRLASQGRTYPVKIEYEPARERHGGLLWDHIARVLRPHFAGDRSRPNVLIFLPGVYEIRKTLEVLAHQSWAKGVDLLPLYGELNPRDQDRAAGEESSRPRIIVATNLAETSITIPGITLVIDSGLARLADYDARRGINTLTIQKISRASADQRAGRAGRTAPGTCIRLWSEADHAARPAQTPPEIHRMDLAEAVLTLRVSGVQDLDTFPWFEKPDARALARAQQLLLDLGALRAGRAPDRSYLEVTPLGRELTRFPVTPRYGRVLVEAAHRECFPAAAEVVAMSQGRSVFAGAKGTAIPEHFVRGDEISDFQPALRALAAARDAGFRTEACAALGVHGQAARETDRLAQLLRRCGPRQGRFTLEPEELVACLLAGFPDQIARRLNRSNRACALTGGRRGQISEASVVQQAELFLTTEITEIEGKELNVLLNLNTAVSRAQLEATYPEAVRAASSAEWDPRERRVLALDAIQYRDLVLESKPALDPPASLAAEILARRILDGELILKQWDRAVDQWIARLHTLAGAFPEYELPRVGEEEKLAVLEQICYGAFSYKQVKDRPVLPSLQSLLASHQRELIDRLTPVSLQLPNGKRARIRYGEGRHPILSAQLQHLYDVPGSPSLAGGRIPLTVEILAPNQRPVQVTDDLPGFWQNSYAQVKKDLKGRYPKHEWR